MSGDGFFYGVIEIPSGLSTSCRWENSPPNIPPPPPYCNSNEWNDYYYNCDLCILKWHCVPITYNTRAGSCSKTFSVYQQLGGDPSNPGPLKNIPAIGGNYPINLTATQQTATIMKSYAMATFPTSFISTPDANKYNIPAAIVVAYDINWFKTIEDLILINPNNPQSPFANTAAKTQAFKNYTVQTSSENPDGSVILNLDEQYYNIATTICGGISTQCQTTTLGYENGWLFCSNFYDTTPGNPCVDILTSAASYAQTPAPPGPTPNPLPDPSDTPQDIITYANAVTAYCNNFNTDNIPPECQCIRRGEMPDYNAMYNLFQSNPAAIPPDKCWWRPCRDPNMALVPIGTINPGQSCPSICTQVVNFVDNNKVTFNNLNISQELSCCATGSTAGSNSTPGNCIPSDGSCPAGTSPNSSGGCTANPPDGKTFWERYGTYIIVGIVLLVVIFIVVIIVIALNRKKK